MDGSPAPWMVQPGPAASCGETFSRPAPRGYRQGQNKDHLHQKEDPLQLDLLWHLAAVLRLAKTQESDEYFQLMIQISHPPSQADSCSATDVPLSNLHAVLVAAQKGLSSLPYL